MANPIDTAFVILKQGVNPNDLSQPYASKCHSCGNPLQPNDTAWQNVPGQMGNPICNACAGQ